ncbi:IS66 family insertion sequence element accessory protein TnpA, partial [Limnospira sp. PMC 1306.21]|uniref:IS66 family insertion sequence element accessory protein TnpA n=1 Tax=Limnospira sp. PMC 1306.21 TaxID=2981089 RepID=UPI0037C04835
MFPLIEQWELSGQTQRDFVAEQGLTHSCFCYWRNRYLKEQHSSSGGFIPVH